MDIRNPCRSHLWRGTSLPKLDVSALFLNMHCRSCQRTRRKKKRKRKAKTLLHTLHPWSDRRLTTKLQFRRPAVTVTTSARALSARSWRLSSAVNQRTQGRSATLVGQLSKSPWSIVSTPRRMDNNTQNSQPLLRKRTLSAATLLLPSQLVVTERLAPVPISLRLLLLPLLPLQSLKRHHFASTPLQSSSLVLQLSPSAPVLLKPRSLPLLQTLNPLHSPLVPELLNLRLLLLLHNLNRALLRSPLALEPLIQTFPQTPDIPDKSLRDTLTLQLLRSSLETRRLSRLQASVSRPMAPHSSLMRQSFSQTALVLALPKRTRSSARLQFPRSSSRPRNLQLCRSWYPSK
jgi:hypothetical protein